MIRKKTKDYCKKFDSKNALRSCLQTYEQELNKLTQLYEAHRLSGAEWYVLSEGLHSTIKKSLSYKGEDVVIEFEQKSVSIMERYSKRLLD